MKLRQTPLAGAFVLEPEAHEDARGIFARTFDADLLEEHGIGFELVQASTSFTARRDTLRGLHFQAPPHAESKIVRCTRGAVFDAIVDLRRDSGSYCSWHGLELSADNRLALFVPKGLAHGFQTLDDGCEVLYMMDVRYAPGSAAGVRWDDPAFGIKWPKARRRQMSERDRGYPDFER